MSPVLGVALLGLAVVGRCLLGSWLAPGAFFALYWSVAFVVPMAALPRDRVPASALLWVALAVVAVYSGSAVAYRAGAVTRAPVRWVPTKPETTTLTWAMLLCSGLGFGAPLIATWTVGLSVSDLLSPAALFAVARAFSVGRYQQTYDPPALGQVLLCFLLAAPLFGGLVAATADRRSLRLLSVTSLLPALAVTLTQTQRAVTLAGMVLWVASYLAGKVACGAERLFTRRHLAAGMASGIAFVALSFLAGWARLGTLEREVLQDVAPKVVGAAGGHASIFGRWFETHALGDAAPGWGVYTFAGAFDKLGLGHRKPGIFEESLFLDSGDESNVYTLFRSLIEDFTVPGAIAVLSLVGILGGAAHLQVRNGRIAAITVLAGFYSWTVFGFAGSIWAYNSVIAAFLICGAVLWRLETRVGRA